MLGKLNEMNLLLYFLFFLFLNKDLWQYRENKTSLNLFNIEALLKLLMWFPSIQER